jgi:hypothetical protein
MTRRLMQLGALLLALIVMAPLAAAPLSERSAFVPGLWWHAARPGHGFEIHPAGDLWFVLWYTYRADGTPIWYSAQAPLDGEGRFDAAVLEHRWVDGRHGGFREVGRLTLVSRNSYALEARWQLGSDTGTWAIEPFPVSGTYPEVDHSGVWYTPGRSGYGLTLSEQGDALAAAVFLYDEAGAPIWYFGSRSAATDPLDLFRFQGACPACTHVAPRGTSAARLEADFDAETVASIALRNAGSAVAPQWRTLDSRITMLSRPASQRQADRGLAHFDSSVDLERFVRNALLNLSLSPLPSSVATSPRPPSTMAPSTFSSTNVQEVGVDEAALVVNDARWLHHFEHDGSVGATLARIRVVEVTGDGADLLPRSILVLRGPETATEQPTQFGLFLDPSDLVAVTGSSPDHPFGGATTMLTPYPIVWRAGKTRVEVFSRTDPARPQSRFYAEFDGHLVASRRIGRTLYLVHRSTTFPAGWRTAVNPAQSADLNRDILARATAADLLPHVAVGGGARRPLLDSSQVFLPPIGPRPPQPQFMMVTRIPLDEPARFNTIAMMNNVDTVYVSPRTLYAASATYEFDIASDTTGILPRGRTTTDIHAFALEQGGLRALGSGRVDGYLNRNPDKAPFRFGENDRHLAVMTVHPQGALGMQRLTVLTPSTVAPALLRTVSVLPNRNRPAPIGKPNEILYGTRFVGDRLYAVTFLQTDPLYVIGLSDPTDPRILGEVELPGFSDYLQPMPQGRLLGVGLGARPASGIGDGQFAWFTGVQLSLFDVSDPTRPRVLQQFDVGKRGSATAAMQHHHGFTWLLKLDGSIEFSLPIRVHDAVPSIPPPISDSMEWPWVASGVFRYRVNMAAGSGIDALPPILVHKRDPNRVDLGDPGFRDAARSGGRSVIYANGVVYVDNGRLWLARNDGRIARGPI